MAELEQTLFLHDLPGELPHGLSRLYFGAEFCFWRLPSIEQILTARQLAEEADIGFTLATPLLGEEERCRLARILQRVLTEFRAGDEVLISDWGALELVRGVRDDLTIILGRTLSGQKRGPRILDLPLNPAQTDYFQRGSWHSHEAVALLLEHGIRRIEQDNLLQGLAPLPTALKGSLHLPYAMVTSSRHCPFRTSHLTSGPCPAPCGEMFTLRSEQTPVLLFQDGNTQFLRNETPPADLAALGIDRIVRHRFSG